MDRRPDRGYGLDRSWSGPVSVFFQSWDWTFKHYAILKIGTPISECVETRSSGYLIPEELLSYFFSLVRTKCGHNSCEGLSWIVICGDPCLLGGEALPLIALLSGFIFYSITLSTFELNSKSCVYSLHEFLVCHLSHIQSILYRPPPDNLFLQVLFQDLLAYSAWCLEHLNLRYYPWYSNTMVLIERLLDDPRCLKPLNMHCVIVDWVQIFSQT